MRPGGKVMISFSKRCFPSKALTMQLSSDDVGRLSIAISYFHCSEEWKGIEEFDMLEKKEVVRTSFMDVIVHPNRVFSFSRDAMGGDPTLVPSATK